MPTPSNLVLLSALLFASVFYNILAKHILRQVSAENQDYEQQKLKTSDLVNENLYKSSLLQNGLLSHLKIIENEFKHTLNRKRRDADDNINEQSDKSLFEKAGEALRQSIARAVQLWNTVKNRVRKTIDSITGNN